MTHGTLDLDFRFVPADSGFWIIARAGARIQFKIEYFALGGRGYQRRGEVEGQFSGASEIRIFVDLGFDPVVAGATTARWSTDPRVVDLPSGEASARSDPALPGALHVGRAAAGGRSYPTRQRGDEHGGAYGEDSPYGGRWSPYDTGYGLYGELYGSPYFEPYFRPYYEPYFAPYFEPYDAPPRQP
jgi:hypothetical protein